MPETGQEDSHKPSLPGPLQFTTVESYCVSDWLDRESATKGLTTKSLKFDALVWVHEAGKTYMAKEHLQTATAAGIKRGAAHVNYRDEKASLDAEDRKTVQENVKAGIASAGYEGRVQDHSWV